MTNTTMNSTSAPNATELPTMDTTNHSHPMTIATNLSKATAVPSTIHPALLHYRTQATIIIQVALLATLGVVIVLGNLASIVTFLKTQSLRKRCHYLVISLSFADFLVGISTFMTMYFFLTGPQFNLFIVTLEFIDTITGSASILTLSVIAMERFYAIYFPFKHRMLRFKFYMACIAFPWVESIIIASLYFISYFGGSNIVYEAYTYHIFIVASLALVVISTSYISIGLKIRQKNPSAQNQNRASREKKLAVTLLIVTLASLLTWIPLQCFLFVLYMCTNCPFPHFNVLFIMKFLQYCNSGLNVFIYIIRMPEFRKAFLAFICNKQQDNEQDTAMSTMGSQTSRVLSQKSTETHAQTRKSVPTLNSRLNMDKNIDQKSQTLQKQNQSNKEANKKSGNMATDKKDFKTGVSNVGFSSDINDTKL